MGFWSIDTITSFLSWVDWRATFISSQIWYQIPNLVMFSFSWFWLERHPCKSLYKSLLVTTIAISLRHCIISNVYLLNCFYISCWRWLHSETPFLSKPRFCQSWSNKLKPMLFFLFCTCIDKVLLVFHFLVTEIIYCMYKMHVICKNFPTQGKHAGMR